MKFVREKTEETVAISLRSPQGIVERLDTFVEELNAKARPKEGKVSRNDLINAMLEHCLTDKSLVLKIK